MLLGETTPPPSASTPTEQKKNKKGPRKEEEKIVAVPPNSLAMATRSKSPLKQSPAAHTRTKRKLPDLNW